MGRRELDVGGLPKPDKHPAILAAFEHLPVGAAFAVVNNLDPEHLREEFDADYPGGYGWAYVESGPRVWRIRICKFATAALPRLLTNTAEHVVDTESTVAWRLQPRERDLDSNEFAMPPDAVIETHTGPDFDVLIHVLAVELHYPWMVERMRAEIPHRRPRCQRGQPRRHLSAIRTGRTP